VIGEQAAITIVAAKYGLHECSVAMAWAGSSATIKKNAGNNA
jgi:hypothetical protein